jgi:hypothetical protein
MQRKEVEKVVHSIRQAICQSEEFQEAKRYTVRFRAFADEVGEVVLALKPQTSMADNLVNHRKRKCLQSIAATEENAEMRRNEFKLCGNVASSH